MEDVDFIFDAVRVLDKRTVGVYGVLDGHGGKECGMWKNNVFLTISWIKYNSFLYNISFKFISLNSHIFTFVSAIFAAEEIPVKIAASLRSGISCPESLFKSFIDTGAH